MRDQRTICLRESERIISHLRSSSRSAMGESHVEGNDPHFQSKKKSRATFVALNGFSLTSREGKCMRPFLPQRDASVLGGGAAWRPPIGDSVGRKIFF